jgi:hypothetical protein
MFLLLWICYIKATLSDDTQKGADLSESGDVSRLLFFFVVFE